MLGVLVLRCDLIAEKMRCLGLRMGDERLFLGQFQFEVIAQKRSQLPLDVFRFFPWPSEPKEGVVRVSHIAEPPVVRIGGVTSRQSLQLFAQGFYLLFVPFLSRTVLAGLENVVLSVRSPRCSLSVGWNEHLFDICVQFVQVDVREDG